jgi:hypothetical protein
MAGRHSRRRPSRRSFLQLAGVAASGALGAAVWNHHSTRSAVAAKYRTLPIGMNLAGIADWEPGFPFLNLMWGSRIWFTRGLSGEGPWNSDMTGLLDLDENGYPLEIPFTPPGATGAHYVFTLLPSVLTAGTYVILYDGEGEFAVGGGSRIVQAQPGRVVITMEHAGEGGVEELAIRRSVRGNHVRNVRVLAIEHERVDLESSPFRPEVLDFCKPWHCLRFVSWLETNDSSERRWANRKQRSFYTQVGAGGDVLGIQGPADPAWRRKWGSGVAIELCIQLANLTHTDAWFCVPHLADDEYIWEMARLVRAKLDPTLKVYVEFSNELWNWQFQQAHWMLRSELAGDLVTKAGGPPPWKSRQRPQRFRDGIVAEGAGDGVDHPERIGALFRRCFKIWENVFAGSQHKLVRVCTIQASWGDTANRTLSWIMRNGGCDAFSPTGYFGPNDEVYRRWERAGGKLTSDAVIADMKLMIAAERKIVTEMAGYARKAGVRLVVYEGGQHIQPLGQTDKPYNQALAAAQKHPMMYNLYRENLDEYAGAGADLFCAFSSVSRQGMRWGSWGHAEWYGQEPSEMPKYRAILDANVVK